MLTVTHIILISGLLCATLAAAPPETPAPSAPPATATPAATTAPARAAEADVGSAPEGFALHGDVERGRALFARSCSVCHGASGDGHGKLKLDPPARDLTDAERMAAVSDWGIYRVIRDGGAAVGLSSKMIPWGSTLSEEQLQDLATFVRSLATKGSREQAPAGQGQAPEVDATALGPPPPGR